MKKIDIVIEKSTDSYGAYAKNVEGIYGAGDTLEDVKTSINDAIDTIKTLDNYPKILDTNYELVFIFDTQSFMEYYGNIFTRASLSRLSQINEKQLGHYIQGIHKPRKENITKIETALHNLGKELLSIKLT